MQMSTNSMASRRNKFGKGDPRDSRQARLRQARSAARLENTCPPRAELPPKAPPPMVRKTIDGDGRYKLFERAMAGDTRPFRSVDFLEGPLETTYE